MRIISLGWGCQSFGLAAMSALGKLPPVDAAVHADTGYEREETYAFAKRWTPWLEARGVPVVTVQAPEHHRRISAASLRLPAFVRKPDGSKSGMLRQQCTSTWKIRPIRRYLQAHRNGEPADVWLGITLDEVLRMKPSDVAYATNVYPFIFFLSRPWRRHEVVTWLQEHDLEVPAKSCCTFCPHHDRTTWQHIKANRSNWKQAVTIDERIRGGEDGFLRYLTRERKPLLECDFRSPEELGQQVLWEAEECTGMCFL